MKDRKLHILLIDDEPDLQETLKEILEDEGYSCDCSSSAIEAQDLFLTQNKKYDVVFSDIHMPRMTGLKLLENLHEKNVQIPAWVFISADVSPESAERACSLGALDVLEKPFNNKDVISILTRIEMRKSNPIQEIMDIVQQLSGVQLGPEKRLLVETRLVPRARAVGLTSLEHYLEYFKKNRQEEIKQLISIMTTHTTEFFRESDHFDYLVNFVFPKFRNRNSKVKIWSAACSTGQEVYSLAIAWFEYKSQNPGVYPEIEFIGTDIDFSSVSKASEGIYRVDIIKDLDTYLINKYFDLGEDEFLGMVRIKDEIHSLCKFSQANLLSETFPQSNCDVIFVRNVLIYFNPKEVEKIANKMYNCLADNGYLFIGHSESLSHFKTNLKTVGNSVYQRKSTMQVEEFKIVNNVKVDKIKVFIVDDSLTIRKMLREILSGTSEFEIVGEADNPIDARELLRTINPDVMVLDIHMPKMTGIEFLELDGSSFNFPVVMLSSVSYEDAVSVLKCFEHGAVDYLEKPKMQNLSQEAERIKVVLKNAYEIKNQFKKKSKSKFQSSGQTGKLVYSKNEGSKDLIVIGASTGGIEALTEVFSNFPPEIPPVLVVQHIPSNFSKAFAKRVNDLVTFRVKEAEDGELVESNTVYIAPGGLQMRVVMEGLKIKIKISDDAPVNRHKPSVDYLFNSLIDSHIYKNYNIVAAILTGMGSDGAKGIKLLHDYKIPTIAQNEETSVVFGMPKVAIDLKAIDEVLPLSSISYHLISKFNKKQVA